MIWSIVAMANNLRHRGMVSRPPLGPGGRRSWAVKATGLYMPERQSLDRFPGASALYRPGPPRGPRSPECLRQVPGEGARPDTISPDKCADIVILCARFVCSPPSLGWILTTFGWGGTVLAGTGSATVLSHNWSSNRATPAWNKGFHGLWSGPFTGTSLARGEPVELTRYWTQEEVAAWQISRRSPRTSSTAKPLQ